MRGGVRWQEGGVSVVEEAESDVLRGRDVRVQSVALSRAIGATPVLAQAKRLSRVVRCSPAEGSHGSPRPNARSCRNVAGGRSASPPPANEPLFRRTYKCQSRHGNAFGAKGPQADGAVRRPAPV